jgi:citrate/tricarballylate utilization protein
LQNDLIREGERVMTICNSCRYCEGYCAVFPAMERRLNFTEADLNYLANLCHNCGECYYACQYAPPHEFAVNIPKILTEMREQSYRKFAWPRAAFGMNTLVVLFFTLLMASLAARRSPGDFYQIIPHAVMVTAFGAVSILVAAAFAIGFVRFWRESRGKVPALAVIDAIRDVLTLKYLDGGGEGCTYPDENRSRARWWFHQSTFYGFLLCFAATSLAAFYHYALDWHAPYPYLSLPVALGTLGGLGLLLGPAGLYALKRRQDPALGDRRLQIDLAFIALLFLSSLSGLALLAFRDTSGMRMLLVAHLGIVMALFVTMPYGKFVHGIYRFAALIRYALERSR